MTHDTALNLVSQFPALRKRARENHQSDLVERLTNLERAVKENQWDEDLLHGQLPIPVQFAIEALELNEAEIPELQPFFHLLNSEEEH